MKSLRTKILLCVCLLVTIALSVVGGTVSVLMYTSSMTQLEKTMTETVDVSAMLVTEYLETYKAVAYEAGTVARLSNESVSLDDKKAIIDAKIKHYNLVGGAIINKSGMNIFSDTDLSDRDYFKAALAGEVFVSDILFGRVTGKYTINVAAPLWDAGIAGNDIVGVVYLNVPAECLSDITNRIEIGDTGSAYMLDKNNNTIAHKTIKVEDLDNTAEAAKDDAKLKPLAKIEAKMCAGESGFGSYSYGGVSKIIAYAPIGINGWSVAVNAEQDEFLRDTIIAIIITMVLVVIAIIVGIAISFKLANSIITPIKEIERVAKSLAEGVLDANITYQSNDELGSLAESMRSAMDTLKLYIVDINYSVNEFAGGNFKLREPSKPFIGDFKTIENAIRNTVVTLSDVMRQIKVAADQVSSGSGQVSNGAQALSQGATEQASSIQELSASITDVSEQVMRNAESSKHANAMAASATDSIKGSNDQMQQLMKSMADIDAKSKDISKIIKTIEDIAFQTNILALNAAVEAARAGSAGKGFAVVADEVRNLAGKSAEAAKNTTALIEDSVFAIGEGVKLADVTAANLGSAVENVAATTDVIVEITTASTEQARSITEITQGIDQISAVVQTNSATAEESAAASEELSGQASMLNELVSKFKLME